MVPAQQKHSLRGKTRLDPRFVYNDDFGLRDFFHPGFEHRLYLARFDSVHYVWSQPILDRVTQFRIAMNQRDVSAVAIELECGFSSGTLSPDDDTRLPPISERLRVIV